MKRRISRQQALRGQFEGWRRSGAGIARPGLHVDCACGRTVWIEDDGTGDAQACECGKVYDATGREV